MFAALGATYTCARPAAFSCARRIDTRLDGHLEGPEKVTYVATGDLLGWYAQEAALLHQTLKARLRSFQFFSHHDQLGERMGRDAAPQSLVIHGEERLGDARGEGRDRRNILDRDAVEDVVE